MVFETFNCTAIYSETFSLLIVVVGYRRSRPVVAFNSEVVICHGGEPAVACSAFQNALCKCNACRYSVALHFSDCYVFIFVKVVLVSLVPTYIRTCNSPTNVCQNCNYNDKESFHNVYSSMCGLQIYIIYIEVGRLEF